MNYTPGPWTVSISDDARIEDRITTADGAPVFVGRFVNYDNARLMAAAPDLLAAVHGLLASCGPQHESETAEMYQERMTLLQWHIDRASEALTKATGE